MEHELSQILATYSNPDESNTKIVGKCLSEETFFRYKAFRLKDARVVWFNHRYFKERGYDTSDAEKLIIENYAYVTGGFADNDLIDWSDSKTFLADRYGCHAPVCNGGSSRCGINGEFQVKGNGVNALVGMNIDEGHSNGKLCLAEAVAEAIWGEVCNNALPKGALRTIAIIDTNQSFMSEHGLGKRIEQPSAIAVREWCIRPAHYERAVYFWPHPDHHYLRDEDHVYVKNSVQKYVDACREKGVTVFEELESCFHSIADQIAASRIKGIPHGSLSSSNIGMNGEFLDFGTITAVPDFDNYLLSGGMGATWDDHKGICSWIRDVLFFFFKYGERNITKEHIKEMTDSFVSHLLERENYYTAVECGLDVDSSLTESDLIALGGKIKTELRKGLSSEKMMEKFDVEGFRDKVLSILNNLGVEKFEIRFPLRDMFFTKYEMVTNPLLTDKNVSVRSLAELIDAYAVKSINT